MRKNSKKSGFSLLELTLAISIVAFIGLITGNVINIFLKASAHGATLYAAQTDVRRSITVASDRLRNAGSLYLLPEKFFNNVRNDALPLEYNYFGVEKTADGKTQLVNYVINDAGTGHNKIIIAEAKGDVTYKIVMNKESTAEGSDALVGVKIICLAPGIAPQEIETSFRALNAGHVTDWSAGSEGIAIAYTPNRGDISVTKTPAVQGGAAIYMILDNSGSMAYSMTSAGTTGIISNTRAYHLRVAGRKFVEKLIEYENVYIGIQGFDTNASNVSHKSLQDLSNPASQSFFMDLFDANYYLTHSGEFTNQNKLLHVKGGTNMGDGFRMAYHNMLSETQSLGIADYDKYITFISDGEPTAFTILSNAPNSGSNFTSYFYYGDLEAPNEPFYLGNSNPSYHYLNGLKSGYVEGANVTREYVNAVAQMIASSGEFKDYFLVAIGELNMSTLNNIATSLGVPSADFPTHVFKANDDINFYMAIESIGRKPLRQRRRRAFPYSSGWAVKRVFK